MTAIATAAALYFYRPPAPLGALLWRLELAAYDARLSHQDPYTADNIVIVAIDDESLQQMPTWPWPRSVHGQLLDRLKDSGVKLVGMDILFDSPTDDPEDDARFAQALKRHGHVILAGQVNRDTALRGEEMSSGVSSISIPYEPFEDNMLAMGLTNIQNDPDAVVRRAWLQLKHQDVPHATLPVALAAAYLGRKPEAVAIEGLREGDGGHPYLGPTSVLVNYCGPAGSVKTLPYYQVLDGLVDPALLRDKIVLVGGTAPILQDVYPTPMARREGRGRGTTARLVPMPGVEVQANVLATLLQHRYLHPAPIPVLWAAVAFLSLLITGTTLRLRPLRAGFVAVLLVALTVVATYLLMWQHRYWLPLVPLLMGGIVAYTNGTVYMYLTEERARLRMRRAWQQRVSAEVLQVILNNPVQKVQGRHINATVMFSDLRGFTTMCHTFSPEEVVERLNEYLTAMTEVIREYGGTIHKFIGDGIMAVFGDPVPEPDHAARAVRAAVAMVRRLAELREAAEQSGKPPMYMGVGLHTGELVAGDIGSEQLLEYTVIGDTVSTASRIEGLNKEFKTCVLMSGQTRAALGEIDLPLAHVATQAVRGRAEALELHTVDYPDLCLPSPPTKEKDA
jgi:adenylate cyclase